MKELVVISGKGGTGKTSIVASFAALAEKAVLADCDVDAADLHLVLEPTIQQREAFSGGSMAKVLEDRCTGCGRCMELCRYDAVRGKQLDERKVYTIDPISCEGCGVCAHFCPEKAIDFSPAQNGEWYISDTRHGPMVHARLGVAEENSGKLVTVVRRAAQELGDEKGYAWGLVDGSPGVGCPVIASITGASLVLIVTEPTLSGMHDLKRVAQLTKRFGIATLLCINKYDLNPALAEGIIAAAASMSISVVGKVRYDTAFTQSQIQGKTLVEFSDGAAAQDVRALWDNVYAVMQRQDSTCASSSSCTGNCNGCAGIV